MLFRSVVSDGRGLVYSVSNLFSLYVRCLTCLSLLIVVFAKYVPRVALKIRMLYADTLWVLTSKYVQRKEMAKVKNDLDS